MSLVAVEANWVCPSCAFSNSQVDSLCHMCGSQRLLFESHFQPTNTAKFQLVFPQYRQNHAQTFDPASFAAPTTWGTPPALATSMDNLHTIHPQKAQINSATRNGKNGKADRPIPTHGRKISPPHAGTTSTMSPAPPGMTDSEGSLASSVSSGPLLPSSTGSPTHTPGHPEYENGMRRDPKLGQNADEEERRATDEGRKVFVGNLKRPITRQEVIDHFSKFGEVERVILNSGFGLVLMATRDGALKATEQRWQALDWRNVEVFVYTKGAKGASWNRPYTVPPRPGPCAVCGQESAEHCSLCTSGLCLNDKTTCTSCCRTCQRSFCNKGKECGSKDGLDSCDYCGALTCLFCALRLEATCAQCGRQFSDRIQTNARSRAERMVNSRIGENDGSVYALVCLLKGDVESSREGQLVAAIDRASKLFDPKASSWCMLTALRAIKELDEAWEATRRVHNLRALRRSAKQWSTDLTALTVPAGSAGISVQQQPVVATRGNNNSHNHHHHGHNGHNGISTNNAVQPAFAPMPYPHTLSYAQQQQNSTMVNSNSTASAALANTIIGGAPMGGQRGEDLLFSALRASESFLMEFDPKPKTELDWLLGNLRNIALSVTRKRSVFLEELCMRMEVWSFLLRRLPPGAIPISSTLSALTPLNALKRAIVELDLFYVNCKSREEFLMRKDAYLAEVLRAARELRRSNSTLSSAELLLRRAGRSSRNCEMRAMLVSQNVMPFDGCLHHLRYRRCAFVSQATSFSNQCPFSHHMPSSMDFSNIDQMEFDAADYEFSNEADELSLTVTATIARQVPYGNVLSPPPQQSQASVPYTWSAPFSSASSASWAATSPAFFSPLSITDSLGLGSGSKDQFLDWNSLPDNLAAIRPEPVSAQAAADLAVQIAALCRELDITGIHPQLAAAFVSSGAMHHEKIWDVDVAVLHKELTKIPGLPAATRVKIINLITERRTSLAPLPSIAAMLVPPLL